MPECIVSVELLYLDEETGEVALVLTDNLSDNCSIQIQKVQFFE